MKKYIYFDLFHLSLVLSLLRLYPNLYRGDPWTESYGQEVYLGNSAAYTQTRFHNLNNHQINGFVHPKNIDNAIERTLFLRDVNSIYRSPYWSSNTQHGERNIFAYIFNELRPQQGNADSEPNGSQSQATATELTQADLDLIEMLWKQDTDVGVSTDPNYETPDNKEPTEKLQEPSLNNSTSSSSFHSFLKDADYSIDSETGQHNEFPIVDSTNNLPALVPNHYVDINENENLTLFYDEPIDMTLRNEFLATVSIDDVTPEDTLLESQNAQESSIILNESLLEQLHDLQQMVSEARVDSYPEDFESVQAGYLDLPSNSNNTENSTAILDALLQNTSLVLPLNDSLLNASFHPHGEFDFEQTNINTLLSLLSDDSDPNPVGAVGGQESNVVDPDLSVANLTVDNTFLSQLINESSMEFSDFYSIPTSTPLQNSWPASTSSDSAVSSMGSDWSDSCSGESTSKSDDLSVHDDISGDPEFGKDQATFFDSDDGHLPKSIPNLPKRFSFFGKQSELKMQSTSMKNKFLPKSASPDEEYNGSSSADETNLPRLAFAHNHTYHHNGDTVNDKEASGVHLEKYNLKTSSQPCVSSRGTRDDKRLLSAKLPLTVKEIVELPIEQFNELLTKLRLSDDHLNLIRDIRRRGKNKVAARTCRKRKVDQILDLQTTVEDLYLKRDLAYANMEKAIAHRELLKQKYQRLHQFVFPGCDPPDPIPATYFGDNSVLPTVSFPLSSNTTSGNDSEHKKRGKHKGASKN